MNIPSVTIALLLLGNPIFAQQAFNTSTSDLSTIRQSYVESLKQLLQRCVKENNVAVAADVSHELDKITSAPLSISKQDASPRGEWFWRDGSTIRIGGDNIATNVSNGYDKGIWHWTDQPKREFQIEWANGFTDKITISPNGMELHISNNSDQKFSATRHSFEEKENALTSNEVKN